MSKISLATKGLSHEEMILQLKELIGEIPYKGKETFLNTPVLVNKSHLDDYKEITELLNKIIVSIALNYITDDKLQDVYQLDEFFVSVLNTANTVIYKTGVHHLDFIYDSEGQARICKAESTSTLNDWLLGSYINNITNKLATDVDSNWSAIPDQSDFLSDFQNEFNAKEPIFLVHNNEKESEINYLKSEFEKNNIRVIPVSPKEIAFVDDKLMAKGELATQFILELNREELRLFEPTVLRDVITKGKCINDVRSIILLNDRRFFSVIFDQAIMPRYVSGPEFEFLIRFIIPTYTLNNQANRNALLEMEQNWILRNNSGGITTGTYVKNECTPEVWKDIITNHWGEYVAQPYFEQKKYTLGEGDQSKEVNLLGSLLSFNGKSYGPGLFKGSSNSFINLKEDGSVILSSIIDSSPIE
ncbi:MAG: hypothetical protein JXR05_04210 [Flavobacteriaceae bacterium]